jgi:uncharacterized membrane protein YoaK (UPF0700 family)
MLRYQRSFQVLALGFAALAGYIDAVGFLSSGGLFVSFMTGNSTRLAIGAAQGGRVALAAGALIVLFVSGVILMALLSGLAGERWRKLAAASGVAGLLTTAAVFQSLHWTLGELAALAMAMGAANTIFQRDRDVAFGVTYMTGTLVKFGLRVAASLRGEERFGWAPYLLLWLGLVAGGITGALAYAWCADGSLWGAVAVSIALSIAVARLMRRSAT